jgi:Zinc-ribbon
MEDMREYFSQLDDVVAAQPMPEEFSTWRAKVSSNFRPKRTCFINHLDLSIVV